MSQSLMLLSRGENLMLLLTKWVSPGSDAGCTPNGQMMMRGANYLASSLGCVTSDPVGAVVNGQDGVGCCLWANVAA